MHGAASATELSIGAPRVKGALKGDVVVAHLRRHINPMRTCFWKHHHRARKLNWIVTLRFTITQSGWVSWARTIHGGKHLSRCLDRVVRRIVFPKPARGRVKVYVTVRLLPKPMTKPGAKAMTAPPPTETRAPPPTRRARRRPTPTMRASQPRPSKPAPPPRPSPKGPSDLSHLIQHHSGALKQCYEAARRRNPALRGAVMVAFDILKDGRVSAVRATGLDDRVAACVAKVIAAIRFPAVRHGGVIKVTYPIRFPLATARR
jgi:hypothetical protein